MTVNRFTRTSKDLRTRLCGRKLSRSAVNIIELSELWPLVFMEDYLCSPKVYLTNFYSIFIISFPQLFDLIDIKLDLITLKSILVLMGHYIGTLL